MVKKSHTISVFKYVFDFDRLFVSVYEQLGNSLGESQINLELLFN